MFEAQWHSPCTLLRTESFGQVFEVILWENEVGELSESGDLLRQLFQFVLRHVELGEVLEITNSLTPYTTTIQTGTSKTNQSQTAATFGCDRASAAT